MKKLTLLFILLYNFAYTQVCFSPATSFSAGANPKSVCKADFNGDTKLDLAVANGGASNVSILLGTGTGSFSAPTNFTVGAAPFSVISADFNGDGKADLASANYGSANVSILLGTGTGSFGAAVNFTTGASSSLYSIFSADFNQDGKADLVCGDNGANGVTVLLGTGTGSFNAPVNFATAGITARSVISADFNQDGKADIAANGGGANFVAVLLGTGTGSFTAANTFATGTGNSAVISADFNGDGKADIASANSSANNISILIGNGTGNFSSPTNFAVGFGASQPQSVINGDFNNDGKVDLATANNGTSDASALLGTGTGSFGTSSDFTVGVSAAPYQIISGDFNGDGKADLAVANYNINNVAILLNTAPSVVAVSSTTLLCVGQSATLTASGANTYSWNPGGASASIVISPTVTSSYTVTGTSSVTACNNTTVFTQTVSACTGITELNLNTSINLYPNPSNGNIKIKSDLSFENAEFKIMNSLGQELHKQIIIQNETEINLNFLSKGVYFYCISKNGLNNSNGKIVIE